MMRWHEYPVAQTFLVLTVMVGVFAVQNIYVTQLFPQSVKKQILTSSQGLTRVAGGAGAGGSGGGATLTSSSCPYDSGQSVPTGGTETNANNAENRWPISKNRHEYDIFGPGYFELVPNTDSGILNLTKTDSGAVDSNMKDFMSSMFGFKPKTLAGAYDVKYAGVPRGNDTEIKGNAPVLEVAVDPNNPIVKVPTTGYNIGGGYEAMVVFAAADRVTLHIGRHEYFVGSKNCANGKPCSGGYWIYVKNICVDQKIQDAYNSVKGAQEAAGADLKEIQLPMVKPGQILGKASNGNKIIVGVRDNGPFISTYKSDYWGGATTQDYPPDGGGTTNPTAVPGGSTVSPTAAPGTAREFNVEANVESASISSNPNGTYLVKFKVPWVGISANELLTDRYINRDVWNASNTTAFLALFKGVLEKGKGLSVVMRIAEKSNSIVDIKQVSQGEFSIVSSDFTKLFDTLTIGIDFPAHAQYGKALKINVKIKNICSKAPSGQCGSSPTASTNTPTPTIQAPVIESTDSSEDDYETIILTNEQANVYATPFPGILSTNLTTQIEILLVQCGTSDYTYSLYEQGSSGTLISNMSCEKTDNNKIKLSGFSTSKKRIIIVVRKNGNDSPIVALGFQL